MSNAPAWLVALASSLKLRIVLGTVAALALGIALVTMVTVRQAEADTLELQRQRELGEAVHTADVLSRRVVELQRALLATAAQLDPDTMADSARLSRFIATQPVLRTMFAGLMAITPDGVIDVYADVQGARRIGLDVADRDYFRRTRLELRPLISEPVVSRVSGTPAIVFTVPLQGPHGFYGVLAGVLELDQRTLVDALADPVGGAGEATVLVTDAYGRVIAHPAARRLLKTLADEPRFAEAYNAWKADGAAAEPSGLHLQQAGEVLSVAGVAGPEWVVWRALPEASLLAPLRAARRDALGLAAGLVALLSLAAWMLLSYLLRPLAQLQHRALHLFDGTYGLREGWPQVRGEIGGLSRVLRDVATERVALEQANALTMKKLGSVMAAAPVGIAFTQDDRFELVSVEFCRLFGMRESQLLGQSPGGLHATREDDERLNIECRAAFDRGEAYVGEWQLRRADGQLFWARLRGRPVDPQARQAGCIWTVYDIGAEISAREQLEWSANHDQLTGVANRHAFERALVRVFASGAAALPAALVIIDLDHFKPINDAHGHAAGDAMLKAACAAIQAHVRATDLVARIGGDEFALVLEQCTPDAALRVAENVRHAVHGAVVPWGEHRLRVGASLGVASLALEMEDVATWMEAADSACYEAKAHGRGAVRAAGRPPLRLVGTDGAA